MAWPIKTHKEVWKGWNTPRRLAVAGFLAPPINILHCGICQGILAGTKRFRLKNGSINVELQKRSTIWTLFANYYNYLKLNPLLSGYLCLRLPAQHITYEIDGCPRYRKIK
jgi:hypothetical protein